MRIPISVKLITVTITLLLVASIPIAFKSYKMFEEESKRRADEYNIQQAEARANEVENILTNSKEKIRNAAMLLLKQSVDQSNKDAELTFQNEKEFISLEIFEVKLGQIQSLKKVYRDEFKSTQQVTDTDFENMRKEQSLSLKSISQGKFEILMGRLKKQIPVLTLGFPIVSNDMGLISHFVVADIAPSRLQKAFSKISEVTTYLVNRNGDLLTHPDEKQVLALTNLMSQEIVSYAINSTTPKGKKNFTDGDNSEFAGAFSKTSYGVTVISQMPMDVILEPSRAAKRESFYITGRIISVALFFIFLFSLSLTSPIEKLVVFAHAISKGNFDVQVRKNIKSQDEVGDLAKAFDQMTVGLKERDKVKNLFNKFHGSSVAEEMINKDVAMGGSRKDVTVFFSDIRGFTAFSENKTPEEVVEMLNEYFAVMVKIITSHGGVVDKFIGDAIMAIWGAPKNSERDSFNAVRACLEMRIALLELNKHRAERGLVPIKIGMGMHCGQAIAGTIGSNERMEYTVIGDTVNMASRIEASTKAFGTDLLISDALYEKIKDDYKIEFAGAAEVKGKTDALKLYKVRGYKNAQGEWVDITTEYSDYQAEHADKVKIAA